MVRLASLLLLAACGAPGAAELDAAVAPDAAAAPDYDRLFPDDRIVDLDLAISAADWALLTADPLADVEVPATLTYDGEVRAQIGVSFKGNSSLNSVVMMGSSRYPFKLDLDEYVDGQTIFGVDKLVLNNGFKDPSYLRETLAYELLRGTGIAAPRTAFARVTLGGEPHGLYTVVEPVDKEFLRAHFADDTGDLMKPERQSGTLQWRGDAIADYPDLEIKTNEDDPVHASFLAFLDALNHGGDLDAVFDVDAFLRFLAVNTLLVNLDSYAGTNHNYYLYEDRSRGQWVYIPWDTNEAYGNFTCNQTWDQLLALSPDAPYCQPIEARVLITRVLADPGWAAQYHLYMEELAAGPWSDAAHAARIEALADLIRADVAADPTRLYSVDDFETNLEADIDRGGLRAMGLTSFQRRRVEAIGL